MKYISRAFIAVILAVLTGALYPAQVFADTPDYISEIKVYEGDCKDSEAEGFTILKGDDNKAVDLNQGSGSTDIGAKGNKAVYLGYKTTKDKNDAITDLALMNMKGGYDVAEYDALMERQMKEQIIPFVENFQTSIEEYRANYNSKNTANKKRAQYARDALNKLTDDDCGGKGLGDLLLNETIYEMAKPKYDALSDTEKENTSFYDVNNRVRDSLSETEKNKHADILTIIAQSNGNAALIIENLITRAADTEDDLWIERFTNTTYEDLIELTGKTPTNARKAVAKMYDDKAQEILQMWTVFNERLNNYEKAAEIIEKVENKDLSKEAEKLDSLDLEAVTENDIEEAALASVDIQYTAEELANAAADVFCKEYLESIDYGDGTLLDFFMQSEEEIEDDITVLYPLAASLTPGQLAGLEFVSLQDLVMFASTDENGYKEAALDKINETSIYLGVDREIYKKGGVALTSDALRANVVYERNKEKSIELHIWSGLAVGLSLIGASAFVGSWLVKNSVDRLITSYDNAFKGVLDYISNNTMKVQAMTAKLNSLQQKGLTELAQTQQKNIESYTKAVEQAQEKLNKVGYDSTYIQRLQGQSNMYKYMRTGAAVFTAAMIIISATLIYLDYKSMKDYYKVDFTPIPHYMVDEKDLIGYNSKGEKIVLKNQSAYYKAVESNRKNGDSYFGDIGNCADMNGCVNPQWLALYAVKSEIMSPILASSLKVVVNSSVIPQGYDTGVHMFGESAAFNLNDARFCWNHSAKSIMVYFKVDKTAPSTTGSNLTTGTLALSAGGGLVLGAAISALGMTATKKRKDKKPLQLK